MLAEPKRKQKISVDPRGLNWSNDDSKFGQKMLEKMGWSKGKGLGANEDGNVDHIANSVKSDKKGVGCSKSQVDNWIAHQDDFNALLSQLHTDNGTGPDTDSKAEEKVQSLEAKSKTAKGRVHYKKFTKGKDLSGAKKEDLDCIFGSRKTKSAPVTPQNHSEVNSDADDAIDKPKATSELTTVTSSTSITDYFAKKMADLQKSRNKLSQVSKPATDDDQSEEEGFRPSFASFSLGDPNEDTVIDNAKDVEELPVVEKSKKKKKKSKKDSDTQEPDNLIVHSPVCENNEDPCLKKKKKNKKKRKLEGHVDESAQVDLGETETADLPVPVKRSKKHKSSTDEGNEVCNTEDQLDQSACISSHTENKKSKKRKTEICEEIPDVPMENNNKTLVKKSKKKRRKRKKKKPTLVGEDAFFNGSNFGKITGYANGITLKRLQ